MSKDKPAGPKFHKIGENVPDFGQFFGDDVSGLSCLSNDDIVSGEGPYRYQHALENGDVTSVDLAEAEFAAKWWYVFRVESKSDDGEVTGAHYRIVFMDGKGRTYVTHSENAVDALRAWIGLRGEAGWRPWHPPVVFRVQQKRSAAGRTYNLLKTVPNQDGLGKPE